MLSKTLKLADGRTLGWSEFGVGTGRPVLCFHGAPACRSLFLPADVPAARLGLRLIAADRPGYGLSTSDPGRSLADGVDDTRSLMNHLGLERAAVLAVSGGCPYAVAAAAELRERVTGLALVSPLGEVARPAARTMMSRAHLAFFLQLPRSPIGMRSATWAARTAFLVAPHLLLAVVRRLLPRKDRQALATPEACHLLVDVTREALRQGVDGAITDLAIYARSWAADLADIDCPSELWQGTDDRIVPSEVAFDLGRRLRGCIVHRLEGEGHFWILSHVDEVMEAVRKMT